MKENPPPKSQDVSVLIDYALEAEDGEPLESARVTAIVTTPVGTFEKTVTATQPRGTVEVQLPNIKNLPELESIVAKVNIEDGNSKQGTGTVPKDPVMATLESVSLNGNFLPDTSTADAEVYKLQATIHIVSAVSEDVGGNLTPLSPGGKVIPFTIKKGNLSTGVPLGDLTLRPNEIAEVKVDLTRNGKGSDTGAWQAAKDEPTLNSFQLDITPNQPATVGEPPGFMINGRLDGDLPYQSESVPWSLTAGAAGSGNFDLAQGHSSDTFSIGPQRLKPGSAINAQATLGGTTLTASATVPDSEPNSIAGPTLTGTPDDPENPHGPYTLRLTCQAIAPRGDGASVQFSGPVDVAGAEVAGHGQGLDLVVASGKTFPPGQQVVVQVSISGGNTLPAIWPGPPPLPAVEPTEPESTEEAPEEEAPDEPPIPIPPPLPPGAATPPPLPPETTETPEQKDDEKPEEEDRKGIELTAFLQNPDDGVINPGLNILTVIILGPDDRPRGGARVRYELLQEGASGEGGAELLKWSPISNEYGLVTIELIAPDLQFSDGPPPLLKLEAFSKPYIDNRDGIL